MKFDAILFSDRRVHIRSKNDNFFVLIDHSYTQKC